MGAVKETGVSIAQSLGKELDSPEVSEEFNKRLGVIERTGSPLQLLVKRVWGPIDSLLEQHSDSELEEITGVNQSTFWRWRKQRERNGK